MVIKYEVIGRSIVLSKSDDERHYLKLLYKGDGTPWWCATASLDLLIPSDSDIQPGDFVTLTVAKV